MCYSILEEKDINKRLEYWKKLVGSDMSIDKMIVDCGELYTDPGSFCSRCATFWYKDRYCINCGLKRAKRADE